MIDGRERQTVEKTKAPSSLEIEEELPKVNKRRSCVVTEDEEDLEYPLLVIVMFFDFSR